MTLSCSRLSYTLLAGFSASIEKRKTIQMANNFAVSFSAPSVGGCVKLVAVMQKMGLVGDVTSNQTVTSKGKTEPGCRTLLLDCTISDVRAFFKTVQKAHPDIQCAHVRSFNNVVEGCILDVIDAAPSRCPQAAARASSSIQ